LTGAGILLRMGVCKAGYSIKDEAPIVVNGAWPIADFALPVL
jgi:hypothetical protein